MNHGRPLPLHGQAEFDAMDYRMARERALEDGVVTDAEARRVFAIADRLAARTCEVAERDAVLLACLAGRDGIRSDRFLRRVRQANPRNVVRFPALTDPLEAA